MPDLEKRVIDQAAHEALADDAGGEEEGIVMPKPRPDVTRKGVEMIGDYRTDALREALGRAPIEDDALMALLILAFAMISSATLFGTWAYESNCME